MSVNETFQLLVGELRLSVLPPVLEVLIVASPVILAGILLLIFCPLWVRYIRAAYFVGLKYTLLEIKLPKDTFKSPLAMELFLTALHQTVGEGNWYAKYWQGRTRPWFSLEMISVEGRVKFLIWSRAESKSFIESSLYAQFPGIEVGEIDDYARTVHFDPKENVIWAAELQLTKEDPYPIKTYIDYALDKDPKEEFKVDPLAPLLESLGSVGPNQQVWMQILVRAHKKEQIKPGHLWKTTDAWKDQAEKIINEIMKRDPKTKITGVEDEETGLSKKPTLTKGEENIISAIERSLTKQAFDVGIRCLYIAEKDFFNPANIGGMLGSWKQFGSESLNSFKPNSDVLHISLDHPWKDYKDKRRNFMSKYSLANYKRRSYFYHPANAKPFVLNTEELATIFHFPGQVAATPSLERVISKKSQAPANLPI